MAEVAASLLTLAQKLRPNVLAAEAPAIQEAALAALRGGLNWPSAKAQAWRHTRMTAWAERSWQPQQKVEALPSDMQVVADALARGQVIPRVDGPTLYFVDGRFVSGSSTLCHDGKLSVLPLDAAESQATHVRNLLGTTDLHQSEAFAALNTAGFDFGALVHIQARHMAPSPIELVFLTTDACATTLVQPRVLVVAETGSQVAVSESHIHVGEGAVFNNAVTEIVVRAQAQVTHAVLQSCSTKSLDVSHVAARVEQDAHLLLSTLDTGSRLARRGVDVALAEQGAEATLVHVGLGRDTQHHDTQSRVRHKAPHTLSRQQFRAIAQEHATSVFGGMVEVKPDAQKIDAQQMSRGLIEGQAGAQVLLQPQLIIDADDVKCSHGATVGQLAEDAMFYLQSRGFHADEARQLLNLAFLGEALTLVPPSVGAPLRHRVARWLGVDPSAAAAVAA